MGVGSWIVAILVFIVAAVLMVLAVRHFMEQGYLLNNAYIYASNEERASMNKMPYYKTIGNCFLPYERSVFCYWHFFGIAEFKDHAIGNTTSSRSRSICNSIFSS